VRRQRVPADLREKPFDETLPNFVVAGRNRKKFGKRRSEYNTYILGPKWRKKRQEAISRAKGHCEKRRGGSEMCSMAARRLMK
jgi:hypothetical protein